MSENNLKNKNSFFVTSFLKVWDAESRKERKINKEKWILETLLHVGYLVPNVLKHVLLYTGLIQDG